MTCIVGLVHESKVYIGGDSAGVSGYDLFIHADKKVFCNGPMVIGCAGSPRARQLLQFALTIPDHDPRVDTYKYMVTTFVNAVRQCMKDGGNALEHDKQERESVTSLVGYQGRLFCIQGDYQVDEFADQFAAIGCGDQIAHGALYATATHRQEPRQRVLIALEAAEHFSIGVRGPFIIKSTE